METFGLERAGIINPSAVYRNLSPACLTEAALRRGEGVLSDTGALVVRTGKFTGRAPKDKFIVDTPGVHDLIAWGSVNRPITKDKFRALKDKMTAYLQNREVFIFDGFAGADKKCRKKFRVITELASENLFISSGRVRKNCYSTANRILPSSSRRASNAIPRRMASIRKRPFSSIMKRGSSSSPGHSMPGKSKRASFRS